MTSSSSLHDRIRTLAAEAGAETVAVAFHDYEHQTAWSYQSERWFHAASTIKIPVLLGVYDAIDKGRFDSDELVHVRNRFRSVADGSPYRIDAGRDANSAVHAEIGGVMRVHELAHHMIVTSSNLATNILVDLVGVEAIQASLDRLHLRGIEFRRGVEDLAAWDAGINNRVTAGGLLQALRTLVDTHHFSPELRIEAIGILDAQEFRSGIPAGLPEGTRVAHKTGEISTVAHDAGIVYLPGRDPWVVVILTEWNEGTSGRRETIARIAAALYGEIAARDGGGA